MPKGDSKGSKGKGPACRPTARRPTARHHNPESEDDTPEQSRPSRMIRPSTASQEENIRKHHADMVRELSEMFSLKSKPGHVICSRDGLSNLVTDNVKDMFDLCRALMKEGKIMYGEYSKLREILVECGVEAGETIDKYTKMIRGESEGNVYCMLLYIQ
ncbi:uncharacterized protein LOC110463185 isoform X2 [Mizuhopecten yessoensis]|uniref:uncharacterized protein LOC110463185 isoform X2 n=1 Tax=Mizuhopecten yessoensis TaxID=6573 RepID=UPI000B45B012|nr:uncharacterized protein LOC110463185 isoform X2 [Mizuhopecten yessoensis]